jgi:hypothetical protein
MSDDISVKTGDTITFTLPDGHHKIIVKDIAGHVIYQGPFNATSEQSLPLRLVYDGKSAPPDFSTLLIGAFVIVLISWAITRVLS